MAARTIEAELRDARIALGEWWQAIRESADNPVVRLGMRQPRPRTVAQKLLALGGWGGLLGVLLWVAHLVAGQFFSGIPTPYALPLRVALAVCGWIAVWISFGLYDAAVFTLQLISAPGTVARGQVELDETIHASRLSDRELAVGLTLLVLPKLGGRLALGPVAAVLAIVLQQSAQYSQEAASASFTAQIMHEQWSAGAFYAGIPLAVTLLLLTGLLAGTILTLWLLALGRGVRQDWQLHLLAGSVTLVQLAWIPLAISRMTTVSGVSAMNSRLDHQPFDLAPFFAFLAVPAFLAGTLHFARRRPFLRLLVAALLPPTGLALWLLLPHPYRDPGMPYLGLTPAAQYLEEQLRYFGALALVNPLALSFPRLLGLDPATGSVIAMFGALRLPVLLLLQFIALAICAHAARLAVHDWRRAEE